MAASMRLVGSQHFLRKRLSTILLTQKNKLSSCSSNESGAVVGVYEPEGESTEGFTFTPEASRLHERTNGQLGDLVSRICPDLKKGKSRIFYDLDEEFSSIAVVGLGKKSAGFNELEVIDEGRENVRVAMAAGVRQLREVGCKKVAVDSCSDAEAAAEGSLLSLFEYDELKAAAKRKPKVAVSVLNQGNSSDVEASWRRGEVLAKSQNFARTLIEMPANKLTPTTFSEIAHNRQQHADLPLTIKAHSRKWAADMKMGAFLGVAKGSEEPPIFLELRYNGVDSNADPLILVGKGVTFDSGGISIKPSSGMEEMRGDMGGAATVVATMFAAATLQLPVNVVALMPLCENMLSGSAVKPGDVLMAMNGTSIQVDNTDAEGRLLLADALCYATKCFNPAAVLDLATLTGAVGVALGSAATGVFSNSENVWNLLQQASITTGDRMWRLPLFDHFSRQVTESHLADINNVGKHSRQGGACTAAAFLRDFVGNSNWAHLDIAGVMTNQDEIPYLGKGMTGRPVRTLVDFVSRFKPA